MEKDMGNFSTPYPFLQKLILFISQKPLRNRIILLILPVALKLVAFKILLC